MQNWNQSHFQQNKRKTIFVYFLSLQIFYSFIYFLFVSFSSINSMFSNHKEYLNFINSRGIYNCYSTQHLIIIELKKMNHRWLEVHIFDINLSTKAEK